MNCSHANFFHAFPKTEIYTPLYVNAQICLNERGLSLKRFKIFTFVALQP